MGIACPRECLATHSDHLLWWSSSLSGSYGFSGACTGLKGLGSVDVRASCIVHVTRPVGCVLLRKGTTQESDLSQELYSWRDVFRLVMTRL